LDKSEIEQLMKQTRLTFADLVARDIVSVQPMPNFVLKGEHSNDQLTAMGYKPVSRIGLLWRKDND
jgi:hypothetical protein